MKIAIPVENDQLHHHFGHSPTFAVVDADPVAKTILSRSIHQAPPHEPGLLPNWLRDLDADVVIAGGMGERARQLCESNGMKVIVGAPQLSDQELATAYLNGTLTCGENQCDH